MLNAFFRAPFTAGATLFACFCAISAPAAADRDLVRSGKKWSIQLQGNGSSIKKRDSDVAVVDPDEVRNPSSLKKKASGGRRAVLAYVSVGEAESYRSYMKGKKGKAWLTEGTQGWKGNYKVKYWDKEWKNIVKSQVRAALDAGYDGVYLDRVDTYERMNAPGGSRKAMIQLVKEVAAEARGRKKNAAVAVQNAEELLDDDGYVSVIDAVSKEDLYHGIKHDGSRNEARAVSASVKLLKKAKAKGKAVHVVEYLGGSSAAKVREQARRDGFVASTSSDRLLKEASDAD